MDQRALDSGSIAAGLTTKVPQLIVHQGALLLRQLLDAGTPPDDPRCMALLQIVNAARLAILPDSNKAAHHAHDLTAKAVHIDVSTATMAAIMGLKNAHLLTGAAVSEAANSRPRPQQGASSSLRLKLLPKLSYKAFDELVHCVRTDAELGQRAHKETVMKTASMAQKINRLRAGQRHAVLRKRRLTGESIGDLEEKRDEVPPPVLVSPARPPPIVPLINRPTTNASSFSKPTLIPRKLSMPPVAFPPIAKAVPLAPPLPPPPQIPRQNVVRVTPPALHVLSIATPSSAPTPIAPRPSTTPTITLRLRQPEIAPTPPKSDRSTPPFARYHARTNVVNRPENRVSAKDKGVLNDAIAASDAAMEAFIQPAPRHDAAKGADNPTKLRTVLAEREKVLYKLLKRRRAELAAMPLGMSEQTRRKAIIETKQLSLLDLQRLVRHRVCAEMKKMFSLSVQERMCVPPDNMSRLFRRRDPPIYSYTDGYPRITPFDCIPEMPPRHPQTVAQDSIRMAQFDESRMVAQKKYLKSTFNAKLIAHFVNFKNYYIEARNARNRMWKGFERHFLDKKRAEDRKKKMERIERLRLLRSNDEQAYFKMLKNTKNERLLQLVRQTDSYLMRLGAQVEREREVVDTGGPAPSSQNTFNEELKDDSAVPIDEMRRRRDLYYTVTHSVQEEVKQPSIMVHGTLKPYQVEGLKWMVSLYNNNLNGILADEMGLGKTIQTISLVTYLVEKKNNPGPFLIIVPLSTMGNWVRELDLWAPSLKKVVYRGNKNNRKVIQGQMAARDFNVLLTTYEFTVKDQHVLSRLFWKYIIIDEGHRMKNANCKLAMTLGVKYKSKNRLLLTGTPLQNDLTELWALLNFLLPTIFSSADTFETWFKQPFETTALGDTAELEEEETLLVINRLHQVLRPFLLRRLKTDVETQLPSKVEHVLHCDMSSWQRVIYRQVKGRIGVATGTTHRGGVKAYNNLLMQCKKICNHPYLFYDQESIDFLPEDARIRASGKFVLLQHMLPKLQLTGHRTLIFSQMTAALDYLEYFLADIGIQYLRLDGNTRADDRQDLLNVFNEKNSPYFCFLLSTRAGGLGLNLQTADTVIIFDSDWNPMMDLQAQDRAHRIGQTNTVRVYRLICPGTVEEKILEQANKKLQIDAQVIQAGQFNNKSTEMDRHQMLKEMLRQKNDDDRLGDVPSMEELNRLFARSDEEFDKFMEYDKNCEAEGAFKPMFTREDELPEWVLQPEIEHKTQEEKEKEIMMSHGRGRRKRRQTHDLDLLTEAEWFKVVEGEMSIEEAFDRRARRKERRGRNRSKAEDASTETEDESGDEEGGDGKAKEELQYAPKANGSVANDEDNDNPKESPSLESEIEHTENGTGEKGASHVGDDDAPSAIPSNTGGEPATPVKRRKRRRKSIFTTRRVRKRVKKEGLVPVRLRIRAPEDEEDLPISVVQMRKKRERDVDGTGEDGNRNTAKKARRSAPTDTTQRPLGPPKRKKRRKAVGQEANGGHVGPSVTNDVDMNGNEMTPRRRKMGFPVANGNVENGDHIEARPSSVTSTPQSSGKKRRREE